MAQLTYDERRFAPQLYVVRLVKSEPDLYWLEKGCWTVTLDWRPGRPTFLSNRTLTLLFRRLMRVYKNEVGSKQDQFQLLVTPTDELGYEVPERARLFVPTVPIDDNDDREEWRVWDSAA